MKIVSSNLEMPSVHPLARTCVKLTSAHPLVINFIKGVTDRMNVAADLDYYANYPMIDHSFLYTSYRSFLENQINASIDSLDITFTRGAVEGIELCIRAFCEPGVDSVVVTPPTFPEYMRLAQSHGCIVKEAPLSGQFFDRLDSDLINKTQGKLLFLCNPNNPVGSVLTIDQIENVLRSFSGMVVVDEVYGEMAGPSFKSAMTLAHMYPNLIILRSFSKVWGKAGLRVGAIIASPPVISTIARLQNPFALSTPVIEGLHKTLASPGSVLSNVELMRARKEDLARKIIKIPCVKHIYPSDTNFILVTLTQFASACANLTKNKCLYTNVHQAIPNSVRLSAGTETDIENIRSALRETSSALGDKKCS